MMLKRLSDKPLIQPKDVKPSDERFEVVGVFNPGVAKYDGKTVLLMRVAERPKQEEGKIKIPVLKDGKIDVLVLNADEYDSSDPRFVVGKDGKFLTSMSFFALAVSEDGINFTFPEKGYIFPEGKYEEYGIEDARITETDEGYYILYSAVSHYGICVMMKRTKNFIDYENLGLVLCPDNKDAALFPEKINGSYYMLHRPSSSEFGKPEMWIAQSDDSLCFGNHRHVMSVRDNCWDSLRIGSSGIPLRVKEGWLLIYHGADLNSRYSLGAVLLDYNEPWKVLKRSSQPILRAELPCETDGFFANAVFSCGGTVGGGKIRIYYGAADKCICGAEADIESVMEALK